MKKPWLESKSLNLNLKNLYLYKTQLAPGKKSDTFSENFKENFKSQKG